MRQKRKLMFIKRYQKWARNGLEWTKWFPWAGGEAEEWQFKNKQLNEYKEVTESEWQRIQKEQG